MAARPRRARKRPPPQRRWDAEDTPLPAPLPGLSLPPPPGVTPPPPEERTLTAVVARPRPRPRAVAAPWLALALLGGMGGLTLWAWHGRPRPVQAGGALVRHAPAPSVAPAAKAGPLLPGAAVSPPPEPAPLVAKAGPLQPPPPALPIAPAPRPPATHRDTGRARHVPATLAARHPAPPAPVAVASHPPAGPVPQLTPQVLRATMLAAEPGMRGCVQEGWGSDVSIGILVAPSGAVQRAEVAGPLGDTATGQCLGRKVRAVRFPAFTQGASKQLFWYFHLPGPQDGDGRRKGRAG